MLKMKIRPCPRCQHHTLVQTSVFWACDACQFAITTIALSIETQQTKRDSRHKMARSSA